MSLKEDFDRDGAVVCRGLVDPFMLEQWQAAWAKFYRDDREVGWNPVEVNGPFPDALAAMPFVPKIRNVVRECLGVPEISVYNHRFVIKDRHARGSVFLHQDTPYHVGGFNKVSAFIALSESNIMNGGIRYFTGTHRLGYLGDAGEIDSAQLGLNTLTTNDMHPGDVLFMHSALWHCSGDHVDGPDRILADIIYMPSDDPARLIPPEKRGNLFVRSRVSRIRELEERVKELENA